MDQKALDVLLDAAAYLVTEDGFDAVSIPSIAARAGFSEDVVLAHYVSLEFLLVDMLDREYERMWGNALNDVERDPQGGLLSAVIRYSLSSIYERPLSRALFLADRDGLNTIMRASHGFTTAPRTGLDAAFIERMKGAGMVRPEVDAERLAAVLSALGAGAALTAPELDLDLANEGIRDLLARAVDADVVDTAPGKKVFAEFVAALAEPSTAE